jgi:hypothetical protein
VHAIVNCARVMSGRLGWLVSTDYSTGHSTG